MQIREAGAGDLEAACTLLELAFCRPDEARLLRELSDGDDLAAMLIAAGAGEDDDDHDENGGEVKGAEDVLGVAVLSHLVLPKGCLALGPLAVARDRRDRGIGKALIAESIGWGRRAGHPAIFVLGQPPYYERLGFSVEAARPFTSPYPADYMMVLELRPGELPEGGELRYPPAFAALG